MRSLWRRFMAWWNADDVLAEINGVPVCDSPVCAIVGPHERDQWCPRG